MLSFALTTLPLMIVLLLVSGPDRDEGPFFAPVPEGWNGSQEFAALRRSSTSGDRIYDKVSESIVLIHSIRDGEFDSRGSGFVLAPGDRLVTNEHVIRDANFVVVETYWGQRVTISKTVAVDERRDLAILPAPRELTNGGLRLAGRTHAIGEKVYSVGSPRNTFFSISAGIISQFSQYRRTAQIVADLHGEPGSSGSPMLDVDGNVLGVVARANENNHLVYAVSYRELAALIAESTDKELQSMPKRNMFRPD